MSYSRFRNSAQNFTDQQRQQMNENMEENRGPLADLIIRYKANDKEEPAVVGFLPNKPEGDENTWTDESFKNLSWFENVSRHNFKDPLTQQWIGGLCLSTFYGKRGEYSNKYMTYKEAMDVHNNGEQCPFCEWNAEHYKSGDPSRIAIVKGKYSPNGGDSFIGSKSNSFYYAWVHVKKWPEDPSIEGQIKILEVKKSIMNILMNAWRGYPDKNGNPTSEPHNFYFLEAQNDVHQRQDFQIQCYENPMDKKMSYYWNDQYKRGSTFVNERYSYTPKEAEDIWNQIKSLKDLFINNANIPDYAAIRAQLFNTRQSAPQSSYQDQRYNPPNQQNVYTPPNSQQTYTPPPQQYQPVYTNPTPPPQQYQPSQSPQQAAQERARQEIAKAQGAAQQSPGPLNFQDEYDF